MAKQCLLQRGNEIQTSWIPNKFAVKGKVLRLKENGVWEPNWLVVEVGTKMILDERERGEWIGDCF